MKPVLLTFIIATIVTATGIAQQARPQLVADLLPGQGNYAYYPPDHVGGGYNRSSVPCGFIEFKDKLLFTAGNGDTCTFYMYDGLNPPVRYSYDNLFANSVQRVIIKGQLYFRAYDKTVADNKYRLYKWDGEHTPVKIGGTNAWLHGIWADQYNAFAALDDKVYFAGADDEQEYALFMHDPATGSTTRLTNEFSEPRIGTTMEHVTAFRGKIYFVATREDVGREVFVYDPTTGTTNLLANINTGTRTASDLGDANPNALMVCEDRLFFRARPGNGSEYLYSYDGINPPKKATEVAMQGTPATLYPNSKMAYLDGRIYFAGGTDPKNFDLWYYDLKTGVAALAYDGLPGMYSYADNIMVYHDYIIFMVSRQYNYTVYEPFIYNTKTGLTKALPFPSGNNKWFATLDGYQYKDLLYMAADGGDYGMELYRFGDVNYKADNDPWQEEDINIMLSPNPATDMVYVDIKLLHTQRLSLTVTDMVGRQLYGVKADYLLGKTTNNINIKGLAQGMYICTVYNDKNKQIWAGKFVKL